MKEQREQTPRFQRPTTDRRLLLLFDLGREEKFYFFSALGHFNQPVVVKAKGVLQGQLAGVRMSLGIEGEERRQGGTERKIER